MSKWKITKEINKEYKDKKINKFRYQIQNEDTKEYKSFYGISKCNPKDNYSSYLGGMLAELRALYKMYDFLWEINDELLKEENNKLITIKDRDFFIRKRIVTKNIISLINSININNLTKARIQDTIRRKKNNMPSRQEEFKIKLENLLKSKVKR